LTKPLKENETFSLPNNVIDFKKNITQFPTTANESDHTQTWNWKTLHQSLDKRVLNFVRDCARNNYGQTHVGGRNVGVNRKHR
jgi:hypothetical protein